MTTIRIHDCDFDCYSKDLGKGRGRGFRVYCRRTDKKCKPQWVEEKAVHVIEKKPIKRPEISEKAQKELQHFMATREKIPIKKFTPAQLFPRKWFGPKADYVAKGEKWYISKTVAISENIVDAPLKKHLDAIMATGLSFPEKKEEDIRIIRNVLDMVEKQTGEDDPVWQIEGVHVFDPTEAKVERAVILLNCTDRQIQGLNLKVYKLFSDRCKGRKLTFVGKYNEIVRVYCNNNFIGFAMPVGFFMKSERPWVVELFTEVVRILCKS